MKARIIRLVRNIFISIVVLLVVFVGAGAAYTWYVGQDTAEVDSIIDTPVETKSAPIIKPVKQAANAPTSASVQMITSPIAPGSNASMIVHTNPDSSCTILVTYNKVPSKDSGLVLKTADEYGIVSWAWTVESSVPLGKWPAKVTCVHNDKSAVVIGDLVVN